VRWAKDVAFRPTDTIYQQLSNKTNNPSPTGIYQLKCNTRNHAYVGQSGRPITTRRKEHLRQIRKYSPSSAYAMHILDNRYEFCPAEETLKLLKPYSKGSRMDCWESLFIHLHHKHNILIAEQHANDTSTIRTGIYTAWSSTPRLIQYTLTQCTAHTPHRVSPISHYICLNIFNNLYPFLLLFIHPTFIVLLHSYYAAITLTTSVRPLCIHIEPSV
jgi:hypothetical protein